MEAIFFRSLAQALPPALLGRRIERIHSPRGGWWTLRLQPGPGAPFLLFSHQPRPPALALSEHRPDNPRQPSSQVMLLRKNILNLRILGLKSDWSRRRLALGLGIHEPQTWLTLDVRAGMTLAEEPPMPTDQETTWPPLDEIQKNREIWKTFDHISPLLRKTLAVLPKIEGERLYTDLQTIGPRCFYLYTDQNGTKTVCPWPLPEAMRQGMPEQRVDSALEAAAMHAESVFFPPRAPVVASPCARKRQARLLQRLEADEQRMVRYCRLADQAQLLRANLHRLPVHSRREQAVLIAPDESETVVLLDPGRTILENMERWFRLADKGRRGLAHISRRRREVLATPQTAPVSSCPAPVPPHQDGTRRRPAGRALPVHRFLSSDGFTILQGKNQTANHSLLTRLARPADYWFHAEHGPGAHVILKRDAPGQDVPEQSMREAATLAGLASNYSAAGRACVVCAEVRHVRAVKGRPGLARVDKVLRTLLVDLDPGLAARLKAASAQEERSRAASPPKDSNTWPGG